MTSPPGPIRDIAGLGGRIASQRSTVVVMGQGYVGLTLTCAAAEAGFHVTGIDIDAGRIQALARGELVVPGVDPELFRAGARSGRMRFRVDPVSISLAEVIAICVPTPLLNGAPDLRFVEAAAGAVGRHVAPGSLVLVESTVYPGTTDGVIQPLLELESGLSVGEDLLLGFSPERMDPGNTEYGMRNTPRVVGGTTPEATEAAAAFYGQFVDKVLPVSNVRVAETSKLLENTFRHVNIALVNELSMLSHDLGIDASEVIAAAATKPFGFMEFSPGPGVGGHCIPLDPTHLSWQVHRETGRRFGVLERAQAVNAQMPKYVVSRVGELLNTLGHAVMGSRILVLGVTYKPDVGDTRESPSLDTMAALRMRGANVRFHDFFVDEISLNGLRIQRVAHLEDELRAADIVLLLTHHSAYDLDRIAELSRLVLDTRNAWGQDRRPNVIPL